MNLWRLIWIVLIVAGVAIELAALARPAKGDTLSELVWAVLSHSTWGKFATWMISAFFLWLIVHFASQGKYA